MSRDPWKLKVFVSAEELVVSVAFLDESPAIAMTARYADLIRRLQELIASLESRTLGPKPEARGFLTQ